MAPPGLTPETTATLRGAFRRTVADKRLVDEAEKANLELDAMSGEQLQKTVAGLFDVSPEVVAKAAALSK